MFLLDSDILSLLHAGDERIGRRISRVDSTDVATTIITKVEILRAAGVSPQSGKWRATAAGTSLASSQRNTAQPHRNYSF